MFMTCCTVAFALATPPATLRKPSDNPRELGVIHWHRDFDTATARAKGENRPLLVLFQEVPGCATCVNYGSAVLSHPLIVEAAETLFVPAAVYNNIKGKDEKVLKRFKEPSWNNPVVRMMRPDHTMLADRVAGDYTAVGLAKAMVASLTMLDLDAPQYLHLLADEPVGQLETATFAMHCFWEGEMRLGAIPGVATTRPGFLEKLEVVDVQYDPSRVDYRTLLTAARKAECASTVFARNEAQHKIATEIAGSNVVRSTEPISIDKQPKYYIFNSAYRYLPMTEAQANRVNRALFHKTDPQQYLSPRQIEVFKVIEKNPDAKWLSMIGARFPYAAWMRVVEQANALQD